MAATPRCSCTRAPSTRPLARSRRRPRATTRSGWSSSTGCATPSPTSPASGPRPSPRSRASPRRPPPGHAGGGLLCDALDLGDGLGPLAGLVGEGVAQPVEDDQPLLVVALGGRRDRASGLVLGALVHEQD